MCDILDGSGQGLGLAIAKRDRTCVVDFVKGLDGGDGMWLGKVSGTEVSTVVSTHVGTIVVGTMVGTIVGAVVGTIVVRTEVGIVVGAVVGTIVVGKYRTVLGTVLGTHVSTIVVGVDVGVVVGTGVGTIVASLKVRVHYRPGWEYLLR